MKEQFVPYELALELKKLGFNDKCLGYYQKLNSEIAFELGEVTSFTPFRHKSVFIDAPLWQQAFLWILNNYNIIGNVYSNASGYMWEMHFNSERGGTHIADSYFTGDCEMSGAFTTYEKAREACLIKLIESCKK